MTLQDNQFAESDDHKAAMAVQHMMGAISDLCEMASQDIGYEFIMSDIDDLELSHAKLGQLLDILRRKASQ